MLITTRDRTFAPDTCPPKTTIVDIEQVQWADVHKCDFRGMVSGKGANVRAFWLIFRALSRVQYLEAHISRTQRARHIKFLELNKALELN